MDYIAQRGWDVYLMDVRGYGRSTRPPEMSQPPSANPPIVNGEVAVKDIGDVVDHILARCHVQRIALLGWSWGTTLMGTYTTQSNEKVGRLVLYAPIWIRETPSLIRVQGPLGACRSVTMEQAQERWLFGVPAEKQKDLIPAGWFDAWWNAVLESDPVGAAMTHPAVRAPNGVLDDGQKYTDRAYWDPRKVTVPVLIVRAEWDSDAPLYMAQAVFARLINAPVRRYVVIGEGTHTVIIERNRMQLFREVQTFLEEPSDGSVK